jgi:cell division protein FtsL
MRCLKLQPEFSRLDKSRNFFLFGLAALMVLFLGASVSYISTHIKVVNIGYKINEELNRKQTLVEENKLLRLKIAQLKSPTRIEKEAKENLGLVLPKPEQIVYLSKLETTGILRSSASGSAAPPPQAVPSREATEKKASKEKEVKVSQPIHKAKRNSQEIIIAKIIQEPSAKSLSVPKTNAEGPLKSKQNVPAAMLDPLP